MLIILKKIIIIALSTLIKDPSNRCIYILSILSISIWATSKHRPFLISNLNYLEYLSNSCALVINITSSFYLEKNNPFLQNLFLVLSFYINFLFVVKWGSSVIKILIAKYQDIFIKLCPNIYFLLLAVFQVKTKKYYKRVRKCFGCCIFFQNIIKKRKSLKQQFSNGKFKVYFEKGNYTLEPRIEIESEF